MLTVRKYQYLFMACLLFALSLGTASITLFQTSLRYSNPIFIGFIFVCVYSLILILMNKREALPKSIIVLSFLHVLGALIYSYWQYKTVISPFPDSFGYLKALDEMSNYDIISYSGVTTLLGSIQVTYPYLNYLVYKVFGDYYALYCANILLSTVGIILIYKTIRVDFSEKVAMVTSGFMLISSNVLLFTGNLLKDSLVLFFTALSIYLYKTNRNVFLLVLTICLLTVTRIYSGVSLLVAILFDVMWIRKHIKLSRKVQILGAFILVFIVTLLNPSTARYFGQVVEFASESGGIVGVIKDTIIAIMKMFFSPFVWNMVHERSAYTILITDSIFFMVGSILILSFLSKFIKNVNLRKKMYFYLIPLVIHAIALGVAFDGDSARQRMGVFFVIVLVYSVGLFYKKESEQKIE